MDVPDAYIVSLPMQSGFYTDLDGDGSNEEVMIYSRCDDESGYLATVDLCAAEDMLTDSFWAYNVVPYYIRSAGGMHYLYLFAELEMQMYLHVYDLTGGSIVKVSEVNVSPFYENELVSVLTDPEKMHFAIFSEDAGCSYPEGNDYFSVGVDGIPAQG